MAKNPLHTKLCDMLGIEFPIIAFTHCKDVVIAVVGAGGFAVLGEAMHTPDEIAADIKWIRDRIGTKPFGIDLVLPASVPPAGTVGELIAKIPEVPRNYAKGILQKYNVPLPKAQIALHQWGGLSQEHARKQLDVIIDERVPVFTSGLGSPAFILKQLHEKGIKVFGLVGKARQAKREIEAGVDVIIAQGYDAAGHTGPIGDVLDRSRSMCGGGRHSGGGGRRHHHWPAPGCRTLPRRGRRVDGNNVAGFPRVGLGYDREGEAARGNGGRHGVFEVDLRHAHACSQVSVDGRMGQAGRPRAGPAAVPDLAEC
jgi:hypothetical protein